MFPVSTFPYTISNLPFVVGLERQGKCPTDSELCPVSSSVRRFLFEGSEKKKKWTGLDDIAAFYNNSTVTIQYYTQKGDRESIIIITLRPVCVAPQTQMQFR